MKCAPWIASRHRFFAMLDENAAPGRPREPRLHACAFRPASLHSDSSDGDNDRQRSAMAKGHRSIIANIAAGDHLAGL